jgi:hypothetical protein
MKVNSKLFTLLLLAAIFTSSAQAQNVFRKHQPTGELLTTPRGKLSPKPCRTTSSWATSSLNRTNNTLYMSEFNEFAQFNSWNRVHATTETIRHSGKASAKALIL